MHPEAHRPPPSNYPLVSYDAHGRRVFNAIPPHGRLTIPRPKPHNFQENLNTEIANEFRFLDERPVGPPMAIEGVGENSFGRASEEHRGSMFVPRKCTIWQALISLVVAVLQICVAIGLIVFAGIRYRRTFQSSLEFVEFDKPAGRQTGDTVSNTTAEMVAILSGSSCFVPAILQILSGLTALFVILPTFCYPLQVLHIIFSSFAVLLWFEGIFYVCYELNLYFVQLDELYNDGGYRLLIGILCVLSVDVLLVPAFSMCLAANRFPLHGAVPRSPLHALIALFSIFCAATAVGLSIPCVVFSPKNSYVWYPQPGSASLVLFGVKELIISCYALFISFIGFFATLTNSRKSRLAAIFSYSLCLIVMLIYLVNGDRIYSVMQNYRMLEAMPSEQFPVSHVVLLSLYVFIWLVSVTIAVNIVVCVLSIFAPVDPQLAKQQQQRVPPYLDFRQRPNYEDM